MTEHYFTNSPKGEFREKRFKTRVSGFDLEFISGSGVFNIGSIDNCSFLLIDKCELNGDEHILDLGCGFGPIGICLLKKYPQLRCDFTDVNKRASALTKKNLALNNIQSGKYKVVAGDGFSKIEKKDYDVIFLNPPQSAGRQLCNNLIKDAKDYLKVGGNIQIVCRHNIGGKQFMKHMEEVYGNCDDIAKKSGVRVYKSIKQE